MPEHKIHLTVQTLSGKYQHPFDPDTPLQDVVDATFEHLHITPAPGELWELRHNDVVLNLTLTIQAAHIPDKAVLMLAPKEGGGGGRGPRG